MTWQEGIVGVQLDIARETRSPLHVLAGPGTGKTLAMMRRIARLLEARADLKRILAVSFTRTAARDLREQLLQLGARGAETVAATTLHSLCFSALLADAVFDATQRRARPLMAFEINQLVNDLKDRFGGKREVPKLIDAYAKIKKEPGSLWHALRRKWATERKGYPINDLAAAGGWRDTPTLLASYLQTDPETIKDGGAESDDAAGEQLGLSIPRVRGELLTTKHTTGAAE